MLIRYVGQYAPVVITARPDLGPVDLHDIVDVDEELGILLCEQTTNWVPGDDEAQAFLEGFWRWVAAHDRVQVVVDDLGNTAMRWVPKPATDTVAAEPSAAGPKQTSTRARRRNATPNTTTQED